LKKILDEENQVLEELHSMLNKTRQRVIKSIHTANNLPIKAEEEDEKRERVNNEIDFDQLNTINEERNDALTLDSMSEFCKNIGFIKEEHDRAFEAESDEEAEERELNKKRDMENMDVDDEDEKEEVNEDEEINDESFRSKKSDDEEDEDANILDDEPIVDRGLGAALKLAVNKGYLAQEKSKQSARLITNANANIQAKHIMIEEKNFYDIDDKYNRNRDKYSGPVSEFSEKSDYKPDIKLDYIDEKGRSMNEKEAFRYLSHRFHGKGSGKKKTEKRNQKIVEMEAMNKMSSVDTPLNTVALLAEKQKRLQQPFVVLSTPKGKNDQVTLHKR
jgi:U4/U6.U5 tri-snRNP-associated protein 1